jgi:hypothetical protein
MAWDIGSMIGSALGAGLGKSVAEAATPFTNAWIESKKSAAATHTIDKQTDRDITIAAYQADVQLGLSQRLLDDADRAHWSTRWIRPAFCALAAVWVGWSLWLWIARGVPLEDVIKYLLAGIVASLFLLRPYEKGKRADIVAGAQQAQKPPLLTSLANKVRGR